jgi:hypothetical protein
LDQGAGKIAGGDREILVWNGNYENAASAAKMVGQIQTSFRAAGWQYEPTGRNGDVEVFSLFKDGTPRRGVVGFSSPEAEFSSAL